MNGLELGGHTIEAGMFIPKAKRGIKTQNNLYVRNFPKEFNKEQVEEFIKESFGVFGEITSKGIFFSDPASSYYAFVCFSDSENAKNALEQLNDHQIEGTESKLYVNYAQSKETRKKMFERNSTGKSNTNLYIKGIKENVTESLIQEVFQTFGEVTSTCLRTKSLVVGGDEINSGFAFINFKTPDQCKEAYIQGKVSEEVLNLVNLDMVKDNEFLFYAQPKAVRSQYLRMKNKSKE